MPTSAKPQIAVAFDGDIADPLQWSGTPYGVASGLRSVGVDVHHLDSGLPEAVRKVVGVGIGAPMLRRAAGAGLEDRARSAYSAALIGSRMAALRSAAVRARLRRLPHLDGIVQIGTGYFVPPVAPITTYEDMTIKQALDYPYRHWSSLTSAEIHRRIDLQNRCYAVAQSCCMTNSWAGRSARVDYGIPAERVHVAGVGSHEPKRTPERDWSRPRFLFVGLDWERKNGPAVVAAFTRVREHWPEAQLDVVGGHPPGLHVGGVVAHGRLRRSVPDELALLRGLFDAATCFVMPSLFEPSAVVYTEAAACGVPSIGTNVGGSADLIGDAGLVIDPTDQEALYIAMSELANPVTAQATSALATQRADLLTWEAVAERLLRGIDPDILGRPLAEFLEPVAAL